MQSQGHDIEQQNNSVATSALLKVKTELRGYLMNTIDAIRRRRSVSFFDKTRTIDQAKIEELVSLAAEAPTAFNMQNWRFIAVIEPEIKKQLRKLAWDQAKVEDASVTFIILGDVTGFKETAQVMDLSVKAGIIDQNVRDYIANAASQFYREPQIARDEAIRSGTFAAMNLMLAAESMGMASCPMIGFDAPKVSALLEIPENLIPVVMLPVGYETEGNWAKKVRRPISEILSWNRYL